MTEAEWLASSDPAAMLGRLRHSDLWTSLQPPHGPISDRKLRLFACACARQVWDRLVDDVPCPTCDGSGEDQRESTFGDCPDCSGTGRINRSRRAVEVAERYADGLATDKELDTARQAAHKAWGDYPLFNPLGLARYSCLPDVVHAVQTITRRDLINVAACDVQASLLREIVGNPFRPVTLPRTPPKRIGRFGRGMTPSGPCPWLTHDDGKVVKIASVIYDSQAWDMMGALHDALVEAGCYNEEMLRHCQEWELCPRCLGSGQEWVQSGKYWATCPCDWPSNPKRAAGWIPLRGPHCRGCWVIDLLTGRE